MSKVCLISGNDETQIAAAARRCIDTWTGAAGELAVETFKESDGRGPAQVLDAFIGAIFTPSLLGDSRTLWLKDFSAFAAEPGAKDQPDRGTVAAGLARLRQLVAAGLPDDVALVLSGPACNRTKSLWKTCAKQGETQFFEKPDLRRPEGRRELARLVAEAARSKGLTLPQPAIEYLAEIVGDDLTRLDPELEKLCCYAGEHPTLAQVTEICRGKPEAMFYALNTAVAQRDLAAAMTAIDQLLSASKDPDGAVIGLTRSLGTCLRDLLEATLLLRLLKAPNPRALGDRVKTLSAEEKARLAHFGLLDKHPYVVQMRAEEAQRYSGPELLAALGRIARADRQLVSSSIPPRLLLETLVLQIVRR